MKEELDEIEEVYERFWKPILERDGEIDIQKLKKELFDFKMIMRNVSIVYDEITGGKISYPDTNAEAVIDAAEDHYYWLYAS